MRVQPPVQGTSPTPGKTGTFGACGPVRKHTMPPETGQGTVDGRRPTSEDLAVIRQKAKQARLSQSEYVTRCCLGRQIVVIDGLKEVLQQQRAIGNNLNRLTILANMGRISAVDLERTAQELADISAALRSIQEQGRRGR